MSKDRRIVITGMGAVTSLGLDLESTWEGIVNCRSGVSRIALFNADTFPAKIAGEVKGFDVKKYIPKGYAFSDFMSRATKYGVGAAAMAMESAKINLKKLISKQKN